MRVKEKTEKGHGKTEGENEKIGGFLSAPHTATAVAAAVAASVEALLLLRDRPLQVLNGSLSLSPSR